MKKQKRIKAITPRSCTCGTELSPDEVLGKACAAIAISLYCETCLTSPLLQQTIAKAMSHRLASKVMDAIWMVVEKEHK